MSRVKESLVRLASAMSDIARDSNNMVTLMTHKYLYINGKCNRNLFVALTTQPLRKSRKYYY